MLVVKGLKDAYYIENFFPRLPSIIIFSLNLCLANAYGFDHSQPMYAYIRYA